MTFFIIFCYATYPVDRYGTWANGHRTPTKGNQVGNNTFVVSIVQFFLTTRPFVMLGQMSENSRFMHLEDGGVLFAFPFAVRL